jgi:hypothetical protein
MRVVCNEPQGVIEHDVWPFAFTKVGLNRLYDKCKAFPVLFGRPLRDMGDFLDHLLTQNLSGDPQPSGLYWIVDDYVGMFYMNNISQEEADVHYTFFDRRHKGREVLVRAMLKMVFAEFPQFNRLNVYVPAYAGMGPRMFVERCGFKLEGCKRRAAHWKGTRFNTYCYGILREEVE